MRNHRSRAPGERVDSSYSAFPPALQDQALTQGWLQSLPKTLEKLSFADFTLPTFCLHIYYNKKNIKYFSINLIMQKHPTVLMPIHIIIQCFYRESSVVGQTIVSPRKAFGYIIKLLKNLSTFFLKIQFYSCRNIIKTTQERL